MLRDQNFRIDHETRQIAFAPVTRLAQEAAFSFEDGLLLVDMQVRLEIHRFPSTAPPFTSPDRDRCGASVRALKGERRPPGGWAGTSQVLKVTLPAIKMGDKLPESVTALILGGSGKRISPRWCHQPQNPRP